MELNRQINADGLEKKVQICSLCDDRQMTTGTKRNRLLQMATGDYTVFIDDDDRIADNYLKQIITGIEMDHPDVIGITGIINMPDPRTGQYIDKMFFHTIRNNSFYESRRGYERPPNHLNPMKREISVQYLFPEKNFGEDTEWATQIWLDRKLKSEHLIVKPIYFYDFKPDKSY